MTRIMYVRYTTLVIIIKFLPVGSYKICLHSIRERSEKILEVLLPKKIKGLSSAGYCWWTCQFTYTKIILFSKVPGKLGKIVFLPELAYAETVQVPMHYAH